MQASPINNLERHRQEALAARQARIAARTAAEQAAIADTPPTNTCPTIRSHPIRFFANPYPDSPSLSNPLCPATWSRGWRPPPLKNSQKAKEETGEPTGELSTNNYLRLLMSAQHASIVQAQAKQEASAARIAWLEETLLALSLKSKPPSTRRPETDRIDLKRFKTSDSPIFNGPFQAIEPFLKWIHGTQIFFATKDIHHSADKIQIAGSLIRETNTLAFYASLVDTFVVGLWDAFKKALFDFALPPLWCTTLCCKIHELRLEICALITNHQLLRAIHFVYSGFKQRVVEFWDRLPEKTGTKSRAPSTTTAGNPVLREQTVWRIHTFLDSQGLCHFCKKTCGHTPGSCTGPLDRSYIKVPESFKTPPKPLGYKIVKPRGPGGTGPGKPTHPPAGRAPNQLASVAAVKEGNLFPELNTSSIAAIAAIDKELRLATEEGYVPENPKRLVLDLVYGEHHLRGLFDTGAKINLIKTTTVSRIQAPMKPLTCPTTIWLALDNTSAPAVSLID
ncbi:hypothetical protein PCANC_17684 [Puccinia coronata f. sp. avenae]|uniref:Uncharacterized protein n=1 Tax=Puccinia coronata f. sp. avenae TaxID=200324 RepID=A0A2N5U957_9BASI|nr:hypothetical protein PCANC_17684 [Puccinia coronata f. sp. avenae]